MIDFGKLSAQLHKGKIINPTEIFMSLPEKSAKYALMMYMLVSMMLKLSS